MRMLPSNAPQHICNTGMKSAAASSHMHIFLLCLQLPSVCAPAGHFMIECHQIRSYCNCGAAGLQLPHLTCHHSADIGETRQPRQGSEQSFLRKIQTQSPALGQLYNTRGSHEPMRGFRKVLLEQESESYTCKVTLHRVGVQRP